MSGPDLWDYSESRRRREEAIARAASTDAAEAWRARAWPVALDLCRSRQEWTTDDLWLALESAGVEPPPEKRAMAGVVRGLLGAGLIERTGRVAKSCRAARHTGFLAVWRSTEEVG